jgi:uncharacterized YccA/Bax inhibitor family protein
MSLQPTIQAEYGGLMTVNGTIRCSCILLVCVMTSASLTWTQYGVLGFRGHLIILLLGLFCGMAVVWVTILKKQWSPITAPIYALLEGFVIGDISIRLEMKYHGIVIQAIALTFVTFISLLFAYRTKLIRVTGRFNAGLAAATSGVALFYLANLVLSMLGIRAFAVFASGIPGIIVSVVVVVIAGLSLVADFGFIEQCTKSTFPNYMEWFAALGLLVTLIWSYMEILRLLSKIREAEETS